MERKLVLRRLTNDFYKRSIEHQQLHAVDCVPTMGAEQRWRAMPSGRSFPCHDDTGARLLGNWGKTARMIERRSCRSQCWYSSASIPRFCDTRHASRHLKRVGTGLGETYEAAMAPKI